MVRLGARSYAVHVGRGLVPRRLGVLLTAAFGAGYRKRVHLIADTRALAAHPHVARHSAWAPLRIPSGESSKQLARAGVLLRALAARGANRSSVILAFGGGVTGDLAGLVASLYMRGIPVVQVPSTLLAQVDASVGGKTAVNLPEGKNLAGTFHQPALVVVDPSLTATLPARELRAGVAEILKAALLAGGTFWSRVRRAAPGLDGASAAAIDDLVRRSIALKAGVVAADEHEGGARRALNLGHTLAHALEAATGYRVYLHGEAVAAGLIFAAYLSESITGLAGKHVADIRARALPLCRRPPRDVRWSALEPFLGRDKKAVGGKLTWVLLQAPGSVAFVRDVPSQALRRAAARLASDGLLGTVAPAAPAGGEN